MTGNIGRNLDATLSGTAQVDRRKTFTDCAYSPAANQIIIIYGDPYLTVSGTLSYLNGAPATTLGTPIRSVGPDHRNLVRPNRRHSAA